MRVRSVVTLAAVVGATITLAACGATDSTAPTPPAIQSAPSDASSNLLGTLLGAPRTITPLKRKTPLAAPITVSKPIGILGGTIAIPQAGIAIVVPPLVKVTVPVAPIGKVAVMVTVSPYVLGPDVVTFMLVELRFTTCVRVPLAALVFVSPAKFASIE